MCGICRSSLLIFNIKLPEMKAQESVF